MGVTIFSVNTYNLCCIVILVLIAYEAIAPRRSTNRVLLVLLLSVVYIFIYFYQSMVNKVLYITQHYLLPHRWSICLVLRFLVETDYLTKCERY